MTNGRTLSPVAAQLLEAIRAAPDDAAGYAVFADALVADGDPQGELIVLMHRMLETPDDPYLGGALEGYLTKYRAKLFGDLYRHKGIFWDLHLGFLRSVRYSPEEGEDAERVAVEIQKLPIAALLPEVIIFDSHREYIELDEPPPGVRYAQRHRSIESALEDPDGALWLELACPGEVPEKVLALKGIEWLDLRGPLARVPAELTKLARLRRLEIDFCGTFEIDEEVLALESLAYVSMYECPVAREYGDQRRLNDLLGGFARARTSSARRRFELALMRKDHDRAFALVDRDPRRMVTNLLAAVDNNVQLVREEALRGLERYVPAPESLANASVALLGSTSFAKKDLTARLEAIGAKLTAKVDVSTTHVIVGESPGGKQASIGTRTIVLEPHLVRLLVEGSGRKCAVETTASSLAAGLASRDEAVAGKALAALQSGVPPEWFTALVVVAQDTKLKKSRDVAKKLLAVHAPKALNDALRVHLKQSLLLESMGETKRSARIDAFCKDAGIEPLDLADLLARRARVGAKYVFQHAPSARIAVLLRDLTKGGALDLSGLELTAAPEELAMLDEVAELDLSSNHLSRWPEPVLRMKSLRRLDLSVNRIAQVPATAVAIGLRALFMRGCQLTEVPPAIVKMTTLEELELSSVQYVDDAPRITGLPPGIGALTKLRDLSFHYNVVPELPAALFSLPSLEHLDLMSCDLPRDIPKDFAKLTTMRTLDVKYSTWSNRGDELRALLPRECTLRI